MAVLRSQTPVAYKTTINRTIVNALRDVFTSAYPEADFQSLNVVTQFPLTEVEYPAIICHYSEEANHNAGVGHAEYFPDPDGNLRKWMHRRFEGTMEFTVAALSPLDRDVLSDALIEVLGFGTLDPLMDNFYIRVYGEVDVDVGILGLLHQMTLNTDDIVPMGESNSIAPWEPEDALVYTVGHSVACHGGFYNTLRNTDPLGYIQSAKIYPYLDISEVLDLDPSNQWSYVFDYNDNDVISSEAVISST